MKKLISVILVLVMIVPAAFIVNADEPSSWAKEEVEAAIAADLVPEGLQKNYTSPVTRGQVAEMFMNLLEKSSGKTADELMTEQGAAINEEAFTDTDDRNVFAANALGIINGTGKNKFTPDGTLKRAQIAAIINRVAKVMGFETEGFEHGFTDITDNYSWADPELGWPVAKGIIKGVGGTRFSPGGDLTTEQAILITYRAYTVLTSNVLTLYVTPDDGNTGDGSRSDPFRGIEAAKAAVRNTDRAGYTGIEIVLLPGQYVTDTAFVFEEADGGTAECPVTYRGEDGAMIFGGITLSSEDFAPAAGAVSEFFPEKEKVVQIDLKQFGITEADISGALGSREYLAKAPALYANGTRQTLARFPNEDWVYIDSGIAIDYDGTEMPVLYNWSEPEYYRIKYGEQYFDRVMSWTSDTTVFVAARWCFLWCVDDSRVLEFNREKDEMSVKFAGGYAPKNGSIFYWYNIPEELDIPGEYYVGEDAVLYYYPTDTFETDIFTIPVSSCLIDIRGAGHLTFDNLVFSTASGSIISGNGADDLTIQNCTVSAAGSDGIRLQGNRMTVQGCHIYDTVGSAIVAETGVVETLEHGDTLIYNNLIENWDSLATEWSSGISVTGAGALISHNTIRNGKWGAIATRGGDITAEYNHAYNTNLMADDIAVMAGCSTISTNLVFRYNYIHDVGSKDIMDGIKAVNPDFLYMGIYGFYHDSGASYTNCYGNVVQNTQGGYLSNGGRGNKAVGNLFINCSHWYVWAADIGFGSAAFDEDGNLKKRVDTVPDYVYSEQWKASNPDLATLLLDTDGADPYDPQIFDAPAHIVVLNNWCHFNKADRYITNWGLSPYNIEEYVYRYADEGMIDVEKGQRTNNHVSTYSSKRDTVDLKELITETAAGVIEIDWDTFVKIGNVAEDWNLDVPVSNVGEMLAQ